MKQTLRKYESSWQEHNILHVENDRTWPPIPPVVEPAEAETAPPAAVFVDPTSSDIDPAAPLVAAPVKTHG